MHKRINIGQYHLALKMFYIIINIIKNIFIYGGILVVKKLTMRIVSGTDMENIAKELKELNKKPKF